VGELHTLHLLAGHLEAHVRGVLHQHAVAAIGHVEGDVLVRQLRGGAAIGVPHVHRLAVLHISAKALAQAVDVLAHIQHKGFHHIALAVGQQGGGGTVLFQGATHGAEAGGSQHLVPRHVVHLPLAVGLEHPGGELATGEGNEVLALLNHGLHVFLVGFKAGILHLCAGEVGHLHADDVLAGGGEGHRQGAAVQHIAPVVDGAAGGNHLQRLIGFDGAHTLGGVAHHIILLDHPIAVGKSHGTFSLYVNQ